MTPSDFALFDQDIDTALLERYLQSSHLAVDTETMGLIPHRDRLCLVQLCNDEGFVSCVRIARGQRIAPNLQHLLEAESVLKIFHFARFDIATLRFHLGIRVQPLFCTKIASKLARTYSPRHGLKDLLQEVAKVELDKKAQSSDWGNAANLSAEQLAYAANDVRYLIPAARTLREMLEREDRWDLAADCFRCLPTIAELDLNLFNNVFEH